MKDSDCFQWSPDFVETSLIFDDVCQGLPRLHGRKLLESSDSLGLSGDVAFMPKLILPLKIRLKDLNGSDQLHIRINTDPENRRVTEKMLHY